MNARVLALVLASACTRSEPAPPVPIPIPIPAHALRIVELAGEVTPALKPGDTPKDLDATLAANASLTLSVDDDVRIELHGPARVALRGSGAPVLLLHHGIATLDVSPQAVRAGRVPFALATPSAQLDVPFAARLVVRALEGAPELAVVSGEVSLSQPAGSQQAGAGARYCFTESGPRKLSLQGFATLEAAGQLAGSNACVGERALNPDVRDRELGHRLDALTATHAKERELLASKPPDLRAQLGTLAQGAIGMRQRALALRAQVAAGELGAAEDPRRAVLLTRAAELESPAR